MKVLRIILMALIVILLVAVVAIAFLFNSWTQGPIPEHEGTLAVAGLTDEVTIKRDNYGVPHIYASNTHDLFFAQGYTQAQDRWWQMEFFRHTGEGSIQELTGQTSSLMGTDIFIRTAGWRAAAERDVSMYDEQTLAQLQAFADGVNAYILNRPAGQLAFEYNVLGVTGVNIAIEPWTVVDTLVWGKVMAWDLSGNQGDERTMADLIDALGEDMILDYVREYPFDLNTTIIQPEDLRETGESFGQTVTMNFDNGLTNLNTQLAGNFDDSVGLVFAKGDGIGSNNWVVSGDKTASGMPLLANDPHLGIQMPSIWYEIGLHCQPISDDCPYNVRGFTFAPTPGVIIGHNDHIAWGVTNVGWDTQDLYRMTINPENDLQYEWNGEWRDMAMREEIISFGDSDETVVLNVRETHLGPIINDFQIDDDGNIGGYNNEDPLALRWTALDPGTLFMAVERLNKASNWDEFREALTYWDTPAQNVIYADIEGNIGYQTPSNVPIRAAGHSGLLPVDGSTDEFEWRGYVPFDYLPSVFNPERGYIATANQALVPLEYYDWLRGELADEFGDDAQYVFGTQWAYGWRGQRIVDMLEATDAHTFETFSAIQGDNQFTIAKDIIAVLDTTSFDDDTLNNAVDWLADWDSQMNMDSAQAALFGSFWLQLNEDLFDDQLDDITNNSRGGAQMYTVLQLLNEAENIWWDDINTDDVVENRDALLARSFSQAYADMIENYGAERDAWQWGTIHTATFSSNPLGLSGIDIIENMVNRGPVPTSGGSAIVNATSWGLTAEVRAVPSMRMIVDMGDFSQNRNIHTTGQSGHPFSAQYEDMIDNWRNMEYKPMLWSDAEVDNATMSTLVLQPAE